MSKTTSLRLSNTCLCQETCQKLVTRCWQKTCNLWQIPCPAWRTNCHAWRSHCHVWRRVRHIPVADRKTSPALTRVRTHDCLVHIQAQYPLHHRVLRYGTHWLSDVFYNIKCKMKKSICQSFIGDITNYTCQQKSIYIKNRKVITCFVPPDKNQFVTNAFPYNTIGY